jgi:hypothetical protein
MKFSLLRYDTVLICNLLPTFSEEPAACILKVVLEEIILGYLEYGGIKLLWNVESMLQISTVSSYGRLYSSLSRMLSEF